MTDYNNTMDFAQLINNKQISDSSKKVYLALLKRIQKSEFKIPIKKNEKISEVSEYIKTFDNPNTRLDMLNLMIVLRTESNMPTDEMKKLRVDLNKEKKSAQPAKMNTVGETLMGYDDFKLKLARSFEDKNYKKFIVNYLMTNYGVRNKDLDLTIISNKKDIVSGNNYLLISPKNITYIRDDYKTHSKYGKQEHIITDPNFQSAVQSVGNSKLIPDSQLVNGLRKLYIDKMGEGQIFKMMIDYYTKTKNSAEIKRISASRGTALDTVKEHYDVNATPSAIELAAMLPDEPVPKKKVKKSMTTDEAVELVKKEVLTYDRFKELACQALSTSEGQGFEKIPYKYKGRKSLYTRKVDNALFVKSPEGVYGMIGYTYGNKVILKPGVSYDTERKMYVVVGSTD